MYLPRTGVWCPTLNFLLLLLSLKGLTHAAPFSSEDGDGTRKEKPGGAGNGELETLRPLRLEDYAPELVAKRDANDFSRLDPQKALSVQYGNPSPDDFVMMNMTLYTNEGESIIFLDQFVEDLESVDCGEEMTLVFNSKDSFEYAIKSWDWVNENETHKFILVTDHSKCAPEDQRQSYHIYDVEYEPEKNTARLRGEKKEWDEVAQNVDLDTSMVRPKNDIAKRFEKSLDPWHISSEIDGPILRSETEMANVSFDCLDCNWDIAIAPSIVLNRRGGKLINFALELKTQGPATMDITTRGMVAGASGDVALMHIWELKEASLAEKLKKVGKGKTKASVIANFLSKLQVPGVFEWDVVLELLFYVGVSKFSADGEITIGALTTLNEGAMMSIDLLQASTALAGPVTGQTYLPLASLPFITDLTGWDPEVKPQNISLNDGAQGTFSFGNVVYLALAIKTFGFKFEFGGYIKIPDFMVSFDTHDSPDTPCANQGLEGTSFGVQFGFSVNVRFGTAGSSNIIGISLSETMFPIKFKIVPLMDRIRSFFGGGRKARRRLPPGAFSGDSHLARRDMPWDPTKFAAPGLGPLFDMDDQFRKGLEGARKLSKKVSISGVIPIVGFYGELPGWCAPGLPISPSEHKPGGQSHPPPPPPEHPEPPKPPPEKTNPSELPSSKPSELPIPPSRNCNITANDVNERSCAEAAPKCEIKFVHKIGGEVAFRCRSDTWTELDNGNFISLAYVDSKCAEQLDPCER